MRFHNSDLTTPLGIYITDTTQSARNKLQLTVTRMGALTATISRRTMLVRQTFACLQTGYMLKLFKLLTSEKELDGNR